jgi:4-diphosphocytidyl-2-C-methyl-D-erythritol kinase
LRLEILGRRRDGYHEIRTIFQQISLADRLRFSLKKGRGIHIQSSHPDLPVGKSNLVYQAAQSILKRSDYRGRVEIEIDKRIPIGAGLGGGSSNAATTLKALNRLLGLNLSQKELMKLGVEIGADVPFFFLKGAAIGSGIGEKLKRIELPRFWVVLINPCFEVSTRWAYQNYVLTKWRFHYNIQEFLKTPRKISSILRNDLEEVVSKKYPQVELMKTVLISAGALGALMTGSGPTVFGVFREEGGAAEAQKKIKRMVRGKGWFVLTAHSILA